MSAKRKNLKTPTRIKAFLQALESGLSVVQSAQIAGVAVGTAYYWRRNDLDFAKRWAVAYQQGAETLETEVLRRAVDGVDEPVFYKGAVVGSVRRYSDTLLMFILKVRSPEKFCDKARTAALMRKWTKEDEDTESDRDKCEVPTAVLEVLAQLADRKANVT